MWQALCSCIVWIRTGHPKLAVLLRSHVKQHQWGWWWQPDNNGDCDEENDNNHDAAHDSRTQAAQIDAWTLLCQSEWFPTTHGANVDLMLQSLDPLRVRFLLGVIRTAYERRSFVDDCCYPCYSLSTDITLFQPHYQLLQSTCPTKQPAITGHSHPWWPPEPIVSLPK